MSALMEICNKRRWQPPEFLLVHDSGPDHRKHFLFRVNMNFCVNLITMLEGEGSAFCDHRVNVVGWECEYVWVEW